MAIFDLYGAKTSNCFRAAIALEEAEITYNVRRIDLPDGEQRQPEFLEINPAGQVPVLTSNSGSGAPFVLTQSNAIVVFAAEQAPDRLLPRDQGTDRRLIWERFFFFVTDVIGPRHDGFLLQAHHEDRAASLLSGQAHRAIGLCERFLDAGPFMAGRKFSIADIAAITIIKSTYLEIDWTAFPQLRQWYFDVSGRPGVVCGLRAFDLPGSGVRLS